MNQESRLVATIRSLHAVAELVLAGAQHAATGEIALRPTPGGFATTAGPELRVEGVELHGPGGTFPITGRTPASLAAAAGVEAVSLDALYAGGPGVPLDELLDVDPDAAATVADSFALGDAALARFAPDEARVLWPEHFDLGISLDQANYGISPGDAFLAAPYAYVGPWSVPAGDAYWDAPFGTARTLADLVDAEGVLAFFVEGRHRLRGTAT